MTAMDENYRALSTKSAGLLRRPRRLIQCAALCLLLVGVLAPGNGFAADAKGKFAVIGAGTLSCQRWLDDRLERTPSGVQSEMWIAGYLTAYNQFVYSGQDITARSEGTFVLDWLDEFCMKRPQSRLVEAAKELLQTLRRRQ